MVPPFDRVVEFLRVGMECAAEATMSVKFSSLGLDNINPFFIKIITPYILSSRTHLFNTILICCGSRNVSGFTGYS